MQRCHGQVKPTLINDGAWHGFIGYQADTRSPSLWVNFNGCDVGFCDCSGSVGGITVRTLPRPRFVFQTFKTFKTFDSFVCTVLKRFENV